VHDVVRQGLGDAFRVGSVARNVAELAKLPKMERRPVVAMSLKEVERFLEAAREDRYYAPGCLLLAGRLRLGEALALTRPDVDLESGKVHVQLAFTPRRPGVEAGRAEDGEEPEGGRAACVRRAHRAGQAEERLLVESVRITV
jgi:integrase